jgi:hypothetical protein
METQTQIITVNGTTGTTETTTEVPIVRRPKARRNDYLWSVTHRPARPDAVRKTNGDWVVADIEVESQKSSRLH